eukprot:5472053-Pleurochrysis_carterae.AAC.1
MVRARAISRSCVSVRWGGRICRRGRGQVRVCACTRVCERVRVREGVRRACACVASLVVREVPGVCLAVSPRA